MRQPFDVAVIEKICRWKISVPRRLPPSLTSRVNDLSLSFSESNVPSFFLSFFLSGSEVNTIGVGTGKGHTGHCTLPLVVRVVRTRDGSVQSYRWGVAAARASESCWPWLAGSGLYYCVRRCRTRTHSHTRRIQYTHTHVG